MSETPLETGNLHSLELRLPPLPQTLPEILQLLHEPGLTDPDALAEIAQRDPAVVARLLQQINSAYYGLRRSVTSVDRAIRMLGPSTAAGAVISLSMLRMRKLMEGPAGTCFTRLVRHSVGTAFLSRYLLRELPGGPSPSSAGVGGAASDGFTEGLLHDFGKLILIYNYPEEAVALYEDKSMAEHLAGAEEREMEQLIFGCDHTEAGAYAATELHFPSTLVEVIRHHHDPSAAPQHTASQTLRAVCGANRVIKALDQAFVGVRPSETELDWEACVEHPIWSHWHRDAGGDGSQPLPLLDTLRTKKEDFVLSTEQFLNRPGAPEPAQPFA
jgi:HD-like signal output (HDOD) protein